MKKKMIDGLKIILGAVITAAIACFMYFGSYELIFLLKGSEWFDCIIVILGCTLLSMIPIIIVIVHIISYILCKKRKYLSPYQIKIMLLISSIFYVIMGYWNAAAYSVKLGFEDGLGFVLGHIITLGVVGVWVLILIALLIWERKRNHNSSSKGQTP